MVAKKVLALVLLAVMLFAGCKRSGIAENIGPVLDDWRYVPTEDEIPEPVEYEQGDSPDFSKQLGFNVTSLPAEDGLMPVKYFAINGWYAQIEYQAGERYMVLRIAFEEGKYLSGSYSGEYRSFDETSQVADREVRVRKNEEGASMATWSRDGFQYLLHQNAPYGDIPKEDIEAMVNGLRCADTRPAMGGDG